MTSRPTLEAVRTGTSILPSSLIQIGTVTRYEMLNYFRSRRFFILLIIGFVMSGILTTVVAYYGPTKLNILSALQFYSFWWANSIAFIIAINGIFFGGDAISGEFQNKTGYFLVPNPLRRSSIYIGKYLGALIASLLVFGTYAAITVGNGIYYFGTNIPTQFGESLVFSIVYLMAVLGLTFFFSALFKTNSMSILVSAILFLFAFSLIELIVVSLVQVEPWFIITYGSEIIGNVLIDPYPTTRAIQGPGGRDRGVPIFAVTIPEGLAIMIGYFVVTAVLGLVFFERKEFT